MSYLLLSCDQENENMKTGKRRRRNEETNLFNIGSNWSSWWWCNSMMIKLITFRCVLLPLWDTIQYEHSETTVPLHCDTLKYQHTEITLPHTNNNNAMWHVTTRAVAQWDNSSTNQQQRSVTHYNTSSSTVRQQFHHCVTCYNTSILR